MRWKNGAGSWTPGRTLRAECIERHRPDLIGPRDTVDQGIRILGTVATCSEHLGDSRAPMGIIVNQLGYTETGIIERQCEQLAPPYIAYTVPLPQSGDSR
jgi:hypothetical protein